ncbi:MAG: UDP-2,4-diacetamido-2,4,6-trideoxy-beta-L-altropyranose hydrolase [Fimbriimonadaceae bacterium]
MIRADGGPNIGAGHIARSLALARGFGAEKILLATRRPDSLVSRLAEAAGAQVAEVPGDPPGSPGGPISEMDADADFARSLCDAGDVLLIDHYSLGAEWETAAAVRGATRVVLDDRTGRRHETEVLIDYGLGASPRDYSGLVPERTKLLLGPAFAPLRPEFADERSRAEPRSEVRRILVSLGAFRFPRGVGLIVDTLLEAFGDRFALDVTIPDGHPDMDAVKSRLSGHTGSELHVDSNRMAELCRRADLAIGTAGATVYERLCLGLPAIYLTVAENQKPNAANLQLRGLDHYLGEAQNWEPQQLVEAVEGLASDPASLSARSLQGMTTVDAAGASRAAKFYRTPRVRLRAAAKEDCRQVWLWANEEEVRRTSLTQDPIPWESHQKWYERRLADPDTLLMIATNEANESIGQIRFQREGDGTGAATITIDIDREFRRGGYGAEVLLRGTELMQERWPKTDVVAVIRRENTASFKAFERAGYIRLREFEHGSTEVYEYVRRF